VVVPQIEGDDETGNTSVKKRYAELSGEKGALSGVRVAMLHGRMPAEERDDTMRRFRAGELDVVIATTVIEVGIDVPNATVIVIESAERFGLSQLHQLRGRVGRGEHASHCLLLSDAATPEASPASTRWSTPPAASRSPSRTCNSAAPVSSSALASTACRS
jgi:ATP-dependent DNA helicase RecG